MEVYTYFRPPPAEYEPLQEQITKVPHVIGLNGVKQTNLRSKWVTTKPRLAHRS